MKLLSVILRVVLLGSQHAEILACTVVRLGPQTVRDWGYVPEVDQAALLPSYWYQTHDYCDGRKQSPIAIYKDDVDINDELEKIEFEGYNQPLSPLILKNLGTTLEVDVEGANGEAMIKGGLMGDHEYELLQFHLHWGPTDSLGSEHTIGDEHRSLELHFVHIRRGLTLEEAVNKRRGLSVLALFFQSSTRQQSNPVLKTITDMASSVEYHGLQADLPPLTLIDMMPSNKNYVTYMGSLTTPPCSEAVIWTVFTEVQPVSTEQLRALRNLKKVPLWQFRHDFTQYLSYNFRPTQPLNGRRLQARTEPSLPTRR